MDAVHCTITTIAGYNQNVTRRTREPGWAFYVYV